MMIMTKLIYCVPHSIGKGQLEQMDSTNIGSYKTNIRISNCFYVNVSMKQQHSAATYNCSVG